MNSATQQDHEDHHKMDGDNGPCQLRLSAKKNLVAMAPGRDQRNRGWEKKNRERQLICNGFLAPRSHFGVRFAESNKALSRRRSKNSKIPPRSYPKGRYIVKSDRKFYAKPLRSVLIVTQANVIQD